MAASLRDVKLNHNNVKRKLNELEDISNTHDKKQPMKNKKLRVSLRGEKPNTRLSPRHQQQQQAHIDNRYMHGKSHKRSQHHRVPLSPPPQQERSPSPSEISSPPATTNRKSVSFDLTCDDKPYEGSPLLTPKEEDDYSDDPETPSSLTPSNSSTTLSTAATTSPTSEPSLIEEVSVKEERVKPDLNTNPDHIALTSSLRLANHTKERITQEIIELSNLQQSYSHNNNKQELIEFFIKLMNNDLNLPKPNKIIKCPSINWCQYHPALSKVSQDFNCFIKHDEQEVEDCLYKSLRVFEDKKK